MYSYNSVSAKLARLNNVLKPNNSKQIDSEWNGKDTNYHIGTWYTRHKLVIKK